MSTHLVFLCVAFICVYVLFFFTLEKKGSRKTTMIILSVIAFFALFFSMIDPPEEGKLIKTLSSGKTYFKLFEGERGDARILGLRESSADKVEKNISYYQVPSKLLVDSQHQLITTLPEKFKIFKDNVGKVTYLIVVKSD